MGGRKGCNGPCIVLNGGGNVCGLFCIFLEKGMATHSSVLA